LRNRLLNTLDDPTLEVHDQNGGVIAFNDNWKSSQRGQIEATGLAPGSDAEPAVVMNLPPARYTAVVRGKDNGAGISLLEIYRLR
jgi:hypothetical protein